MRASWRLILGMGLVIGGCSPDPAGEGSDGAVERTIRWNMTSSFASAFPHVGTGAKRLESQLALVSGGTINLKFQEPGALAPALEGFDAVSAGAIEAAWATPGYWAGKVPALQMFGAVPFGPDSAEYLAWFYNGGGREIFDEIYHQHNIHSMVCGAITPEAAGWFKKEINTPDDFVGLKVRYFGLGAKVIEKLGASTQLLAGGDIYPALELGTIDGAEFSAPSVDVTMGFYQAAPHYYLPGWHQQTTFYELMINLDLWNGLSDRQRAIFETVCGDNVRFTLAESEAAQGAALHEIAERGTTLHVWSDEILDALRVAWDEVAAEMAAEDEDFARAWNSYRSFREQQRTWRETGYIR